MPFSSPNSYACWLRPRGDKEAIYRRKCLSDGADRDRFGLNVTLTPRLTASVGGLEGF